MADMMTPGAALLVKLGSIAVHAEEMLEPGAHDLDRVALLSLLNDAEVQAWRRQMDAAAMLPVKRSTPPRRPPRRPSRPTSE